MPRHSLRAIFAALALASCKTTPPTPGHETVVNVAHTQLAIPIGDRMMEPLGDGLYTEPGVSERERLELERASATARRDVESAFGTLRGKPPITLFCHTAACKIALGAPPADAAGSSLGFARDEVRTVSGPLAWPTLIVSGPFEATPRVLAHERIHAEMKAYAPYDALPTWFNEGMATFIAHQPVCDSYPRASIFDVRALDTRQKWQAHLAATGDAHATYCEARNEVGAWAESFETTHEMIARLKTAMSAASQGSPFEIPKSDHAQ
jgi:hypothetical protein